MEPGSYWSATSRFRCPVRRSTPGPSTVAIARMSPVRGSAKMAMALFAPVVAIASRSFKTAMVCASRSIVLTRLMPGSGSLTMLPGSS